MEDIDGGLHPAVDGQSLDEDEDEDPHNEMLTRTRKPLSFASVCGTHGVSRLGEGGSLSRPEHCSRNISPCSRPGCGFHTAARTVSLIEGADKRGEEGWLRRSFWFGCETADYDLRRCCHATRRLKFEPVPRNFMKTINLSLTMPSPSCVCFA